MDRIEDLPRPTPLAPAAMTVDLEAQLAAVEPFLLEPAPAPRPTARTRWRLLRRLLLLADVLGALAGGTLAAALTGTEPATLPAVAAATAVGWCTFAWLFGLYAGDDLRAWASGAPATVRVMASALALSWPLHAAVTLIAAAAPSHTALLAVALAAPVTSVARGLARAALHRRPDLRQRTLIVGSGVIATDLVDKLRTQAHFGLEPIGFVDDDPHPLHAASLPCLGRLEHLPSVIDHQGVDRVIIAFSRASHAYLLGSIRACRERRVAVDIVPRLFEFLDGSSGLTQIGGVPLLTISVPELSRASRAAKRALDLALAGGALLALSPLLALVAVAIKLDSRGPVLFKQVRLGRGGRPFEVFKFRSMLADAEARKAELQALNEAGDDVMFKIRRDPRITRVGGVIRRASIDELPQLINVVRGEMSLVGPRPLIPVEAEALAEDWQAKRLDLLPGITGPWQVSGRSDVTVHEMARMDYAYVAGWSLARDVEILAATVPAVLAARGAY